MINVLQENRSPFFPSHLQNSYIYVLGIMDLHNCEWKESTVKKKSIRVSKVMALNVAIFTSGHPSLI